MPRLTSGESTVQAEAIRKLLEGRKLPVYGSRRGDEEDTGQSKAEKVLRAKTRQQFEAMTPEEREASKQRAKETLGKVGEKKVVKDWSKPPSGKLTPPLYSQLGTTPGGRKIARFPRPTQGPQGTFGDALARMKRSLEGSRLVDRPGKMRAKLAWEQVGKPEPEKAPEAPRTEKKVSFTPRQPPRVVEQTSRTGDTYSGASPQEEEAHADVVRELKSELSNIDKDRMAQISFLKKKGTLEPEKGLVENVEKFRETIPEDDEGINKDELLRHPLIGEDVKEGLRKSATIKPGQLSAYVSKSDPENPDEVVEFLKRNPFLAKGHLAEYLASRSQKPTEKSTAIIKQSVPFPDEEPDFLPGADVGFGEQDDTELATPQKPLEIAAEERRMEGGRPTTGFGLPVPSRVEKGAVAPMSTEQEGEWFAKHKMGPIGEKDTRKPTEVKKVLKKTDQSKLDREIAQLKKFNLDRPDVVENLKKKLRGLTVRKYAPGTPSPFAPGLPRPGIQPARRAGIGLPRYGTESVIDLIRSAPPASENERAAPLLRAQAMLAHKDQPSEKAAIQAQKAEAKTPEKRLAAILKARARALPHWAEIQKRGYPKD